MSAIVQPYRLASTASPATYVNSNAYASSGTTQVVALPSGAAKDDWCIIFVEWCSASPSISGGAGGWSTSSRIWYVRAAVLMKKLEQADIDDGSVTIGNIYPNSLVIIAAFRNVAAASIKTDEGDGTSVGGSLALTGFTKSGSCQAIVVIVSDRDTDQLMTFPSGFTPTTNISSAYYKARMSHLLTPASYTNGAALTTTGLQGSSDYPQHGYVIELTA